jgi:hypothetical protein
MFTLLFIIMIPASTANLSLVYIEAPPVHFTTIDECLAWRDDLRFDALAAGWDVTVAQCVGDPTI